MSDLVGGDILMCTYHIGMMIHARIKKERWTQQIRNKLGLSRHHTIATGICKNGLPLSCARDGSHKPSPLRNITNAADIVPSLQPSSPLVLPNTGVLDNRVILLRIPTNQSTGQDASAGTKRSRID